MATKKADSNALWILAGIAILVLVARNKNNSSAQLPGSNAPTTPPVQDPVPPSTATPPYAIKEPVPTVVFDPGQTKQEYVDEVFVKEAKPVPYYVENPDPNPFVVF